MSPNQWIPLVVVVDILITAIVVWFVIRHVSLRFSVKTGGNFRELAEFAKESHARTGEYVRSNYGGDPAMLPQVLSNLLAQLEHDAAARNLRVERGILEAVMIRSLTSQRLVPAKDIRAALARAA